MLTLELFGSMAAQDGNAISAVVSQTVRLLFTGRNDQAKPTKVAPEHFSNLDANGFRLDQFQRPEFFRGTIDYVVPSDYWASNVPKKVTMPYISIEGYPEGPKTPLPMNYVFAFDVSNEAIHSGFLAAACENLRTVLYGRGDEVQPCFPPASEIAILTFDSTLHYYDLSVRALRVL